MQKHYDRQILVRAVKAQVIWRDFQFLPRTFTVFKNQLISLCFSSSPISSKSSVLIAGQQVKSTISTTTMVRSATPISAVVTLPLSRAS